MDGRVEAELRKYGIDVNSKFYDYIGRSIALGIKMNEIISKVRNSPDVVRSIENDLVNIQNINNQIVRTRYSHYNMLRNAGSSRPIEAKLDANGRSYMDSNVLINSDKRTYMGAKQIDESLRLGDLIQARYVAQMMDKDLRAILDMDIRVKEQSRSMEDIQEDPRRHYTPQGTTARQMATQKRRLNKKRVVGVAAAALLLIAGINKATTINDPSLKPIGYHPVNNIPYEQRIEDMGYTTSIYATQTPTQQPVQEVKPTVAPETKVVTPAATEYKDPYQQYLEMMEKRNTEEVGPYESRLEKMSPELISCLADAIKEGDKNLPSIISSFVLSSSMDSDKETVKRFLRRVDSVIGEDKDPFIIAYHVGPVLDTLIKYDVMQNKDGKVSMDEMDFYFKYGPRQNAVAVSLQKVKVNSRGYKERVKDAKYLINGDTKSNSRLVRLSLARGTLAYVLGEGDEKAKIGFTEISQNSVIGDALSVAKNGMLDLIDDIERGNEMDR